LKSRASPFAAVGKACESSAAKARLWAKRKANARKGDKSKKTRPRPLWKRLLVSMYCIMRRAFVQEMCGEKEKKG